MFISVIVPVYNVEKYLDKCLESLLNQHYSDMEIVVVDDKSTDGSLNIAKKYEKHTNVKVVAKEKNSGLSDTRNVGIKESCGQYIMFLDSDDYVENGCIAKIQGIIEKENAPDIIYFGYYEEYESTDKQLIKYGYVSAKNSSFTGEILHEDELWTPQVILRANKVYTSDYVFYHYLRRNGSITRSGNKTKHGQDMLCICKKLDILANEIKNPELKKYMDNHIAMLYMKGMTEGRLYQTNMEIDRFYPLRKVCFKKDRAKAILFAFSLRLYYRINIMKTQG